MKSSLSFSLLIPCYNAEKYIDSFLENFSKLSIPFDEVIFYNDASTDRTAQIIKSKGYKLIEGKINKGPGFARNRLAEAAKSDYIHFHDIDDEINPAFLELMYRKISIDKSDVLIGNADWLDGETRQTEISWQYNQAEIKPDPLSYFITHPLGIINTVYKKDAFLKVNGFNEKLYCWEDADLHIKLALSKATFSVIDAVLAYSIRHNTGISKNQGWCWSCRMNYLEKYTQELDKTYLVILGKEFEKTSFALLHCNQFPNDVRSFFNSRKCGYDAPEVNNRILKVLKKLSPLFAFLLKGLIIKF